MSDLHEHPTSKGITKITRWVGIERQFLRFAGHASVSRRVSDFLLPDRRYWLTSN